MLSIGAIAGLVGLAVSSVTLYNVVRARNRAPAAFLNDMSERRRSFIVNLPRHEVFGRLRCFDYAGAATITVEDDVAQKVIFQTLVTVGSGGFDFPVYVVPNGNRSTVLVGCLSRSGQLIGVDGALLGFTDALEAHVTSLPNDGAARLAAFTSPSAPSLSGAVANGFIGKLKEERDARLAVWTSEGSTGESFCVAWARGDWDEAWWRAVVLATPAQVAAALKVALKEAEVSGPLWEPEFRNLLYDEGKWGGADTVFHMLREKTLALEKQPSDLPAMSQLLIQEDAAKHFANVAGDEANFRPTAGAQALVALGRLAEISNRDLDLIGEMMERAISAA